MNDTKEKEIEKIREGIVSFDELLSPLEKDNINILIDKKTGAYYYECHILARKLVDNSTIDVPLDPEIQPDYRANRDIYEDHSAYIQMKEDALKGRGFSNIVAEYNSEYDKEHPLKIIGGQHRFIAIKEALDKGINEYHGIKVYFRLNTEQRLDVQLISNTNIAVAGDLLDRMYETVKGPELRNWCQRVGLLEEGQDFADKKQRGSQITVRGARSFIVSYFEGRKIDTNIYEKVKPEPLLAKTGGMDEQWDTLRNSNPKLWEDNGLLEAGKAYATLYDAQYDYITNKKGSQEYADKALNHAIITSWAYIAGVLYNNKLRLKRHFELYKNSKTDPLNAVALAGGRHKTDPQNYRGLGTRTDMKERGRLAELFFAQAEKGDGISSPLVDFAIKKYHAKLATLEVADAESKLS
ncbi:MAG: hypothetical protein A2539_07290 [Elusimicrobia bacterium RIFOXYD2_FULL_34_15]|nr:MAG: hypothetical protein A2539_07290 [Elusimicrobia bacterium RIFOXYD2_FULL_34_15]